MQPSELVVTFRPNNQISLRLQNVVSARKDIYQCRYIGKSHYSHEENGLVIESTPSLKQWQKNLLADRIKSTKLASARLQKCKKHTKVSYDFSVSPPLDIIRKSQQLPWLAWCAAWKFLTLRKVVFALVYFGEYRTNRAKQFGNIQGQKLRECGSAIDMLCGGRPEFAHVTTLTLPASTEVAFDCIAARSGYIINRLWEPIRKAYGKDVAWFFVWEYQKRGALHAHICHYHPDATEGMLIGNILIEQWDKILHDISNESGIDMFEPLPQRKRTFYWQHQHHTQPMRKSAGGYFSKYAGKAEKSEENNYVRKFSQMRPPSRFWGSSSVIKKLIEENSISYKMNGIPSQLIDEMEVFKDIVLEKEVVLYDEYEWNITIRKIATWKSRKDMNPNTAPTKYVSCERLTVSEGFCQVFYVSPSDYQQLLSRARSHIACLDWF